MEWDGKNPPAGEKARINGREVNLKSTELSGVSKRCRKRCNKRGQSLWPQVAQIRNGHRLSGLRVKEPKAVPKEGADAMAPFLPLPQGPWGLDWVLGPGFALLPIVLASVSLLSFPSARERSPPFSLAPLQVGCRLHHHGDEAPAPVGLGLSGRWESRVSMSRVCIYEQSCGSRRVCVCTWGGVVCVMLCGSELLWVCPCAWGPGEREPV